MSVPRMERAIGAVPMAAPRASLRVRWPESGVTPLQPCAQPVGGGKELGQVELPGVGIGVGDCEEATTSQ